MWTMWWLVSCFVVCSSAAGSSGLKSMIDLYGPPQTTRPPYSRVGLSHLAHHTPPHPTPPDPFQHSHKEGVLSSSTLEMYRAIVEQIQKLRLKHNAIRRSGIRPINFEFKEHSLNRALISVRPSTDKSHVRNSTKSIAYFWHIADLHWDLNYGTKESRCWRSRYESFRKAGPYGNHACNSPWALVESAVKAMAQIRGEDLEFILLSGDLVSDEFKGEERMAGIQNVTELFMRTFTGQFVFPVLGETDPTQFERLAAIWKVWMPNDAIATFIEGGFYVIEFKQRKLKVIILNTNLWTEQGSTPSSSDPAGQWAWLESVLSKCDTNKEMAYMVGHIAPGGDERQETHFRHRLLPKFNMRYIDTINKFAHVISGQFFSHLHSDTFRIVFSKITEEPISSIFLVPSVTPLRTPSGANNPGIRLYQTQPVGGKIINYEQFFLDLDEANSALTPTWHKEYDFLSYYNYDRINPRFLNSLAQNFLRGDERELIFEKYWMANSVQGYKSPANLTFANNHFCTITHIDYELLKNCLSTRASPLAASHPGDLTNTSRSTINHPSFPPLLTFIPILFLSR